MGILGSSIEIGFSRCLLPVVSLEAWNGIEPWLAPSVIGFGRGLDEQRAPSNSWEPFFPAARGGQGAKLAGGDAQWRALDGPGPPEVLTNMRSRARRSGDVESWRRPRGFSIVP